MKKDNPFTLTFGKQPVEYVSRFENTNEIISTFDAENPVCQTYLIEGVRGSGKTVLMTSVANELDVHEDWVIVNLNATQNLMEGLAMRLADTCERFPGMFQKGFSVSIAGFGLGMNGGEREQDYVSIIEKILIRLKKGRKKVLITIDEVLPNKNMRHFASQFQIFIREDYPVYLIMTGLYENIYAVQNDPSLTFLLRTPKIRLAPLSIRQIANQYARIFEVDQEMAGELAAITKGYAFAFQALGMLYYEYRDVLLLDDILGKLDDMLDDFVYGKVWETLSAKERTIILAIPDVKIRVRDLCEAIEMKSEVFSKYRDRLIKKGIITAPEYGFVAQALPRMSVIARTYR